MSNQPFSQQDLALELTRELIKEKRSARRWKNIRFFLWFLLFIIFFLVIFSGPRTSKMYGENGSDYVALVRLEGMIESGHSFSAEEVIPVLRDAFRDEKAKGVILDINSGGGTPVQASIIHDAIIELKKKYHKKVIVVGEDLLASGAYYVAVGADKIYVNPNTVTGSIGVIMKGFGFNQLLTKLGIERRVYTSGANKDRLDPFLPQNEEDVEKIKSVIGEIHHNFDQIVLTDRKGKLKASPDILFSGDFWAGQKALELGLVDSLGNLSDVLKAEFNVTRYKDYGSTQNPFKALLGQLGTSLSMMINSSESLKVEAVL